MYANELVQSVFEDMEWTAEQIDNLGQSPHDYQRDNRYKAFLTQMSTPVYLDYQKVSKEQFIKSVEEALSDCFFNSFYASTLKYVTVYDVDIENRVFKLKLEGTLKIVVGYRAFEEEIKIASNRQCRLSHYVTKYINKTKRKLCELLDDEIEYHTYKEIERDTNEILKDFSNNWGGNSGGVWVYFATKDFRSHYEELGNRQNLTTCMTRPFYLKQDGKRVYPTDGYHFAPDFRLALVSEYSPDEIKHKEDYPFIGRAILSYHANRPKCMSFSKFYGNERVANIFHGHYSMVEKPIDSWFYMIAVDDISEEGVDTAVDYEIENELALNATREQGYKMLAFTAPYIDKWANHFQMVNENRVQFTETPEGLKAVLVRVCDFSDEWEDDEEEGNLYHTPHFNMHYASGLVRQSKGDYEYTRSILFNDDEQELVYGDWHG